jgi:hypothetical protein
MSQLLGKEEGGWAEKGEDMGQDPSLRQELRNVPVAVFMRMCPPGRGGHTYDDYMGVSGEAVVDVTCT